MNKYVIDLRPDCKVVQEICESDGKVSIGAKSINYLEELNSDYINEHFGDLQDTAYKKGLHDGESKCRYCNEYQKGFEDGKAVNDKGCEGCKYSGTPQGDSPCFNCSNYYQNNWTAKDDKIVVGDEVKHKEYKNRFVVTKMQGEHVYGISKDGSWNNFRNDGSIVKTGRHFDIDKILEEMRND